MTERPAFPAGIATGMGSLPGTDPAEAAAVVFGELPDLPHLAELPARGPGADMIGRSAALLVDVPVELAVSGWRLADRPGIDVRRARDFLARDLDALTDAADGYAGRLKLQVTGPWTLAAGLELRRGERAVRDPGASRDLAQSLAEGLRLQLAEVRRRVPGAEILVQLDEPSLPAVLAGRIRQASGLGTLRAVAEPDVRSALADVIAGVDAQVLVHCCAPEPPMELFRTAGAAAIAIDLSLLTEADDDTIGTLVEAGTRLVLGVVPGTDGPLPTAAELVGAPRRLWHRLGFRPEDLADTVSLSPSCGLAGASPDHARAVLALVRAAARYLAEPDD